MISSLEQFASRGMAAKKSVDAIVAALDPMMFTCLSPDEIRDHLRRTTMLGPKEIESVLRARLQKGPT